MSQIHEKITQTKLPIYRKTSDNNIYIKVDENLRSTAIGINFGPNKKIHMESKKYEFTSSFYDGTDDYRLSDEAEWIEVIRNILVFLEEAK